MKGLDADLKRKMLEYYSARKALNKRMICDIFQSNLASFPRKYFVFMGEKLFDKWKLSINL